MRNPDHFLFFADRIENGTAFFSAEECRHAVKVLRMGPDSDFRATDGKGALYTCCGLSSDYTGGSASVTVTVVTIRPLPKLTLFVGLPDRDAFEKAVEACAPLGVARIVPVHCERCQDRWWAPLWDKIALRLRKLMISAIKQSHNMYLPDLLKPLSFGHALTMLDSTVLFADSEGVPFTAVSALAEAGAISCFIGPPGGFSDEEIAKLTEAKGVRIRLGPFRLRTELAATVLSAMLMHRGSSALPASDPQ